MLLYLLLILSALFPYLAVGSIWACMYTEVGHAFIERWLDSNLWLLFVWIFVFWLIALILSVICTVLTARRRSVKELARINLILKCLHIPVYVLIFCIAVLFFIAVPLLFLIVARLCFILDAMTIITSGVFGLGTMIKAREQNILSSAAAVLLAISQFVFCADVICAAAVFLRIRKNEIVSAPKEP